MSGRNKGKPTVSVVIPTYDRAHLIGHAIQSVLNQTYKDIEIIVVDDCSNDKTEKVLRSLKDKRIRYIRHEKNKGSPAARNTGIRAAKGKYIAFQDSDDEWHPKKLEKQMKVFENAPSKVGVVYTAFLRIKNNKKEYIPYSWVIQKEGDIHKELLKGNFVATPTLIARKECFENAGMFDERLTRLQDWELAIRLSKYYDFKYIDEVLLSSPYTSDSITADKNARIVALKLILSKHLNDFAENKKILSEYYYGIGIHLCLNKEFAEGDIYIVKAFQINQEKQLLSENYFIIGRRLCSGNNIKEGRKYLLKALKIDHLNIKSVLVFFVSLFGKDVYRKAVEIFRKKEITKLSIKIQALLIK